MRDADQGSVSRRSNRRTKRWGVVMLCDLTAPWTLRPATRVSATCRTRSPPLACGSVRAGAAPMHWPGTCQRPALPRRCPVAAPPLPRRCPVSSGHFHRPASPTAPFAGPHTRDGRARAGSPPCPDLGEEQRPAAAPQARSPAAGDAASWTCRRLCLRPLLSGSGRTRSGTRGRTWSLLGSLLGHTPTSPPWDAAASSPAVRSAATAGAGLRGRSPPARRAPARPARRGVYTGLSPVPRSSRPLEQKGTERGARGCEQSNTEARLVAVPDASSYGHVPCLRLKQKRVRGKDSTL